MMLFDSVEECAAALSAGEVMILTDDESRENEGDLICAGSFATPENINFLVTHGRGVLCVPLDEATAARLNLTRPAGNHDPRGTAFTQSLDAIRGTTTGVSAYDRSRTVAEILRSDSTNADFYTPGHVFPLLGRPGGVRERDGHTEGVLDLLKIAGQPPVGVLCEILSGDGTMARLPELEEIRRKFGLKIGSIASLKKFLG